MGIYSPNIIANSFISCARDNADHPIIIYGGRRISWAEYTPRVLKIAQALVKLGVNKNDKVAFMFHNTDLCYPADIDFITWLNAIPVKRATTLCGATFSYLPLAVE